MASSRTTTVTNASVRIAAPLIDDEPLPVESAPPPSPEPAAPWEEATSDAFGEPLPDAPPEDLLAPSPLQTMDTPFDTGFSSSFDSTATSEGDAADAFAPAAEYDAPFGETAEMPFPSADEPTAAAEPEDFTATLTMADLYARQGLVGDAQHIYEHILQREPDNDVVRAKLQALTAPSAGEPSAAAVAATETATPLSSAAVPSSAPAKVARLEQWLAKVGRREVPGV